MYAENSPRSPRRTMSSGGLQSPGNKPPLAPNHHGHGHISQHVPHSQGGGGVRPSTSAGSLLSPGRSRRTRSSSQSSRSDSPLTLPDNISLQSANAVFNMSQAYLLENSGSSPSRSPYQSPAHSRSSSMTSVKSLLRDRSLDRGLDRDPREHRMSQRHAQQHQHQHDSRRNPLVRDRSLDRQMDRHTRDIREFDGYATYGGHHSSKDRSYEREYPHMGARSLERDHHSNLVRSRSIDYEYLANQSSFLPPSTELQHVRDTLILDLKSHIADMNKECACLQQELDNSKDKLNSSMNSIKTFWSPELKKERSLRKEESAKQNHLTEQLRVLQAENQRYSHNIREMEQEVSDLKESRMSGHMAPHELDVLKKEKERQAKEIVLLRRTVEEMELRIDTQKQTLGARDESIKKLLEMLQSKGLAVKQLEEDRLETERLNAKIVEGDRRVKQLEKLLEQKDQDMFKLKEDILRSNQETRQVQSQCDRAKRESGNIEGMQALVESKESRIVALEKELKIVEDELLRIREEGLSPSHNSAHMNGQSTLQFESMRSQEKLLKAKLENVKAEVSRKDTELYALRTQMETLEKQGADRQQHITVLREQIAAKEQQAGMLQADIDLLRERLKEKDEQLEKKGKTVTQAQTDKKRTESEMNDVRDHLDIKDRKINVLQRKVENLEELVQDKETQISASRSKLASLHADHHSSDSTVASLEETIADKERQIERLKEQRERSDREHQEETEGYQRSSRELKTKVDGLQGQVDEKQNAVLELRETASELKAEKLRKESALNQMEIVLSQKNDEVSQLQDKIKRTDDQRANETSKFATESERRMSELQTQVEKSKEEITQVQAEVDRLLDILKQMEDEKFAKDTQIKELQDQVKDSKQKLGALKRNQQTEKAKNAQMLEEARKREVNVNDDASSLKTVIKDKVDRIEELEEALRESVKITAQREMVMEEQEQRLKESDMQVKCMVEELEKMNEGQIESDQKIDEMKSELEAKEKQLKLLQSERNKQLADVYEMKQEAVLAAISEKDAHIALLEMAPNAKTENIEEVGKLTKDKITLQSQLKELTQRRMKLLQGEDGINDTALAKKLHNAPRDQVIQAIRTVEHRKKRFQSLIDQLLAVCLEISPDTLEGLPRIQLDHGVRMEYLRKINHQQLLEDLAEREKDCNKLQDYVNMLVERIRSLRPDMLEGILMWLDGAVYR